MTKTVSTNNEWPKVKTSRKTIKNKYQKINIPTRLITFLHLSLSLSLSLSLFLPLYIYIYIVSSWVMMAKKFSISVIKLFIYFKDDENLKLRVDMHLFLLVHTLDSKHHLKCNLHFPWIWIRSLDPFPTTVIIKSRLPPLQIMPLIHQVR